jgi:hypothetical protein
MSPFAVRFSTLLHRTMLFVLFSTPLSIARADLLTPADEVVETLIQAQGLDLTWLVRAYGNDSTAVLHFSSTTDVAARTFSFTLLPGATYLGMPLMMSSIGSGNSASAWHWTTMATLGAQSYMTTGSGQYIDPPNTEALFDLILPDLDKDQHSDVTYDQTAARTVSVETTSFTMFDFGSGKDIVYQTTQRFDTYVLQGPDAGKWVWSDNTNNQVDGHALKMDSSGFSPLDGGAGSFTATFAPEPSTVVLFAVGLLAICIVRRITARSLSPLLQREQDRRVRLQSPL